MLCRQSLQAKNGVGVLLRITEMQDGVAIGREDVRRDLAAGCPLVDDIGAGDDGVMVRTLY